MSTFVVDIGYACFAIYVKDNGICSDAPPIAKWMRGKPIWDIKKWVRFKGGTIEEES